MSSVFDWTEIISIYLLLAYYLYYYYHILVESWTVNDTIETTYISTHIDFVIDLVPNTK